MPAKIEFQKMYLKIFFRDKRNSTPIYSYALVLSRVYTVLLLAACKYSMPLLRAADSISCLIGVGAPSDYKPPNGGFIYLQK